MKHSNTNKFLEIAEEHKKSSRREKFSGTFSDYLELLENDKDISILAHKRLYTTIVEQGITRLSEEDTRCNNLFNGEALRTYDYFQDRFFWKRQCFESVPT